VHKLLLVIQARKSIGSEMWKDVEADFNVMAVGSQGFSQHPALSLNQKFTLLCDEEADWGSLHASQCQACPAD
jgi:hypothetical protein